MVFLEVEKQLVFVAFNSQEYLHILRFHQNGNLIVCLMSWVLKTN